MILFVTAYDDATRPNLEVARLLQGQLRTLFEGQATREHLWALLTELPNEAVLAMSHGRRTLVRAQGGGPPDALSIGDEDRLGLRRVFAWACLTSAGLGVAASRAETIWVGFPVKIAAPSEDPRLQRFLAEVLDNVVNSLDSVVDEASCRALLDKLVDDADLAMEKVVQLSNSTGLVISSSVQQCFDQIQLRLEAWMPGREAPIRPSRAPKERYEDLEGF
jgi:hypothetical protein